jgi:hypothetical protein
MEEVKTLGSYEAEVNFHKQVKGLIAFEVVGE